MRFYMVLVQYAINVAEHCADFMARMLINAAGCMWLSIYAEYMATANQTARARHKNCAPKWLLKIFIAKSIRLHTERSHTQRTNTVYHKAQTQCSRVRHIECSGYIALNTHYNIKCSSRIAWSASLKCQSNCSVTCTVRSSRFLCTDKKNNNLTCKHE